MNGTWSPSVVVGIDFGMTCTGVAYSSEESNWARPQVIQRWPDNKNRLFNKIATRVAYNAAREVVDWGACTLATNIASQEREFKLYLDPTFRDDAEDSPSNQDAVKYYTDFMTALHDHVETTLEQRLPRWQERNVEYRFSIPTTWTDARLTDQLKRSLALAGFKNTFYRRVVFSRTEAEAAAVYAARQYQRGDVIMVVDAGGATTDINILEVTEQTDDVTQLVALDKAEGINVGSVMIDTEARRIIEEKLKSMHVHANENPKWLAENMMQNAGFEIFKCKYDGRPGLLDFYMEIPGRSGQRVILKCSELRRIFDALIGELIRTMREKISSLAGSHPRHQLRYIVMSGGLGSSKYIRHCLLTEFCTGQNRPANALNLHIPIVDEPQLAVVKGIVMDRAQTIHHGLSIYTGRCCRVSYGVLCRLPYNKEKHFGEPTVTDPLTKALLVEDQIDWFIKEGEVVPETGILRPYTLKVGKDRQYEPFCVHIVMCLLPALDLPPSRHRGPVKRICTVKGMFSVEDFSNGNFEKVKGLFNKKKEHDVARFHLKIMVGSADLAFELVALDGRSYSQTDTEKVKVTWYDVKPAVPRPDNFSRIFPGRVNDGR